MSATDIRKARAYMDEQRKKYQPFLTKVPEEEWRPSYEPGQPLAGMKAPAEVWRSQEYLVQVYEEGDKMIRLSCCRARLNDEGGWQDNLSWDELQRLKLEVGLGLMDAVEIYPSHEDIVNVANMRHLWVLPKPIGFAWRAPSRLILPPN